MKNCFFAIFLFAGLFASAQQSVKIMHYNVLNFGVFTDYCTIYNNDPANKTDWLKTVVDYNIPDILAVNELSPSQLYQDIILNEVMNASGRDYFERAQGTNNAGSEIVNMLYFNADKFGLAGQDVIEHYLRDMNVYRLYYKSSGLANGTDTSFLYLITAHFKAGSSGDDKITRGEMAALVMDYIVAHQILDACIFSGDFNLQNNLEPAWINLTSGAPENFRFSDPANQEGIWHNNPDFASVHTQSTNMTSNGCIAAGGMDDRFDFVLINNALQSTESKIKYVAGSYTIPGQDGLRFNGSLVDPPNSSAPAEVINAMYHLSDHVPVTIELTIDDEPSLPASWNYVSTMNTHIIALPVSLAPTLNRLALPYGSYIGAFCLDSGIEKCGGNIIWNGFENVAVVVYGDDITTIFKDGFDENEPVILKVFSPETQTDFYADAEFNKSWPQNNGLFFTGGISSLTRLDAYYLHAHSIEIRSGWNGISSFLTPKWQTLESVFGANFNDVIFISDGTTRYYPAGGNTDLSVWQHGASLLVKTSQAFTLEVEGVPVSNEDFDLSAGWNVIAIPIPCYIPCQDIALQLGANLKVIKAIVGTDVYWPENEIHSLPMLIPGKSYLINVTDDCSLTFEPCD